MHSETSVLLFLVEGRNENADQLVQGFGFFPAFGHFEELGQGSAAGPKTVGVEFPKRDLYVFLGKGEGEETGNLVNLPPRG